MICVSIEDGLYGQRLKGGTVPNVSEMFTFTVNHFSIEFLIRFRKITACIIHPILGSLITLLFFFPFIINNKIIIIITHQQVELGHAGFTK